VNEGKILFEFSGKNPILIKQAIEASLEKLPIKTKILYKNEDLRF
jgi:ribosomal protein L16/L10AE